jgi:beta-1,4-mannosyltransferase
MKETNSLKVFLYPMVPVEKMGSNNSYVHDLSSSLGRHFEIVNDKRYSNLGVLSLFNYLLQADVFYFNWLENISNFRFGKLQFFFAYLALILIRLLDKPIVWTMHNKASHANDSVYSEILFAYLVRNSNIIVAHSQESYNIVAAHKSSARIFYYFHPIKCKKILKGNTNISTKYDILVWGTVTPYKGVLEFLQEMKNIGSNLKIKVVGKFGDHLYLTKVKAFENECITIEDKFLSNEEISELHAESRFVLFPYLTTSVLNSGALVESLCYRRPIIGPSTGAFADLAKQKLILTYEKLKDIELIVNQNAEMPFDTYRLEKFCRSNTWENFASELAKRIRN